jgi:hypothetical protein
MRPLKFRSLANSNLLQIQNSKSLNFFEKYLSFNFPAWYALAPVAIKIIVNLNTNTVIKYHIGS